MAIAASVALAFRVPSDSPPPGTEGPAGLTKPEFLLGRIPGAGPGGTTLQATAGHRARWMLSIWTVCASKAWADNAPSATPAWRFGERVSTPDGRVFERLGPQP